MTISGLNSRAQVLHQRIVLLWFEAQRHAPDLHEQLDALERRAYAVRDELRRRLWDSQQ